MGLLSNLKDMNKLRKQAKQIQDSLEEKEVTGEAGGVIIKANGVPQIQAVEVDENLLASDQKEKLEEAIKNASNDLQEKLKKVMMEEMPNMSDMFK